MKNLQRGELVLQSILRVKKLLYSLNDSFHKKHDYIKAASAYLWNIKILHDLNQTNIAIAVQVFYNLGINEFKNIIMQIFNQSIDVCSMQLNKYVMLYIIG